MADTAALPVAVVGAGPAGCAAALALSRGGHAVHLFERGWSGKDKPCGDALLPGAVDELLANNVPEAAFRGKAARPFNQIDLWDEREQVWTVDLGEQPGFVAPRALVDQALRDATAPFIELRYRATARRIAWQNAAWEVTVDEQTAQYAAVVVATGARNTLSRQFGVDGRPVVGASVSAYAEGGEVAAPRFQFLPLGFAGYCWLFPLPEGHVNVGVCAVDQGPRQLRTALAAYIKATGVQRPGPPRGGAGPTWSGRSTAFHDTRGLVSCGDAAGLVDPITGEGIDAALRSGRAAGDAVAAFLTGRRDPAPLHSYSDWVATTFTARYRATSARRVWRYLNESSRAKRVGQ